MVRFKKIRPRRGSLAVSIIWGSPIAASNRSAALAYRIGSLRHDSRYSAIDMSLWLRASKDLAKALNRESLYMTSLRICSASLPRRIPKTTCSTSNQHKHIELIGHSADFLAQCTRQASIELRTGNCLLFKRKSRPLFRILTNVATQQHQ